jgi:hypothetical protein
MSMPRPAVAVMHAQLLRGLRLARVGASTNNAARANAAEWHASLYRGFDLQILDHIFQLGIGFIALSFGSLNVFSERL